MNLVVPRGGPAATEPGAPLRWRPQRRSALYQRQAALGAAFVGLAGWQVPSAFRLLEEELAAARAGVGLVDLSHLGKLRLIGREAAALLAAYLPDGVPAAGRALPIQARKGGADVLLLALAADEFLLLTESEAVEATEAGLELALIAADGACVHLADLTSTLAAIGLAGPRSCELLRRVTPLDLRPWRFPNGSCAQGRVAKVPGLVARLDRGGLPSYRLLATRGYGEYLWDTLWETGRDLAAAPLGHQAWEALGG